MKLRRLLLVAMTAAQTATLTAQQAAQFDMSLTNDGKTAERVSNQLFKVQSQLPAFTVAGPEGQALRFDGYSNFVKAAVPSGAFSTTALTVSVTLAAETYPMMKTDVAEDIPTFGTICGNLDEAGKKGFAWQLSSQGDLRFQYGSASGFMMTVAGNKKLPRGQWCQLAAVLDKAANTAAIYLNGEQIGTGRMSRADIAHSTLDFYIGKDATEQKAGPFLINTFCGLIDDISIRNEVVDFSLVNPVDYSQLPLPDFSYPASRYESSLWRPQFHAMPSGSWTNETHGMTYSDGRYHVFFQKNANGPYMSRLHWGHISSENLYDWRDEPIAIAPGESYDIKGCWSGCVYEDGSTSYILYTAVDNAKATIAQARSTDATLAAWDKQGVIINGRPSGLSDDFRDPYYFVVNGQKYIIVGTSKNGVGACTLHRYQNGSWTNDGAIFFQGGNQYQHGTFWEMPNVTPMGDGRWLFTCTPLNTGVGVRTLCWVGTISGDGKFVPDGNGVQYLEMGGISRDGYGLLSPTIYQKDGKTLLLGIVPDKLPTQTNFQMGWAHNYSLPREISLAADGSLVQKPYSGLAGMRTATAFVKEMTLTGTESLVPVSGRQIELLGEFTVGSGTCGFNFLKTGNEQATLSYDADRGTLSLDLTSLDRTVNDNGSYKGVYTATLPKKVNAGEKLTLHVFVDGSVVDIFVNETWAFSVRVFPNKSSQTEAEVFTTGAMAASVKAWTLDAHRSGTGILQVSGDGEKAACGHTCDLSGRSLAADARPKGVYIRNGKKYVGR